MSADLAVSAATPGGGEVCNTTADFGEIPPQSSKTKKYAFKIGEASFCGAFMGFDLENIVWTGGGPRDFPNAYGFNVPVLCDDVGFCNCSVLFPPEVSPVGQPPLRVSRNGALVDLTFRRATGATNHNVYVSTSPFTQPFAVTDPAEGKKDCGVPWTGGFGGAGEIAGYDVEAGISPGAPIYFILMSGDNGAPTEGTLGFDSDATEREADSRCAD